MTRAVLTHVELTPSVQSEVWHVLKVDWHELISDIWLSQGNALSAHVHKTMKETLTGTVSSTHASRTPAERTPSARRAEDRPSASVPGDFSATHLSGPWNGFLWGLRCPQFLTSTVVGVTTTLADRIHAEPTPTVRTAVVAPSANAAPTTRETRSSTVSSTHAWPLLAESTPTASETATGQSATAGTDTAAIHLSGTTTAPLIVSYLLYKSMSIYINVFAGATVCLALTTHADQTQIVSHVTTALFVLVDQGENMLFQSKRVFMNRQLYNTIMFRF